MNGNDLLYYFLKRLLESDDENNLRLSIEIVTKLGIWFSPETYASLPVLLPFVVRDPKCRGNPRSGAPDQWSSPNRAGFLRDDNSLVKALPRSLKVLPPHGSVLHGDKIGSGFVAAHVWRIVRHEELASRIPILNTFIPNLVWLPSQIAKLSDLQGGLVQKTLEAVSVKLYREFPVNAAVRNVAEEAWGLIPSTSVDLRHFDCTTLNFFEHREDFVKKRIKRIDNVRNAITGLLKDVPIEEKKIITSRYTEGLPGVERKDLLRLLKFLDEFSRK
jgi:hypothetical protein